MIELSVNGTKVEVEAGASVLDAARKLGIFVPTLCYQRDLSPYGGCRMCTVEIEGDRGLTTSCNTPAEQGMVVLTDTEKVHQLRKDVLELLLSEHPSSCLVCEDRTTCWDSHECTGRAEITTGCKFCPQNERCGLQFVVRRVTGDGGPVISIPSLYRAIPVDRRDPFIDRDDNLCILCGRCVRACEEQALACVLDFMHRGVEARVGTAFNRTLVDSGCQFDGACVDACPTGSLSERVRRWEGPAQGRVLTTCSFCGVGCQFHFCTKEDRVIEALPRRNGEVAGREACVRGRFAVAEFNRSVCRLKTPLLRRNGVLVEVPWETALTAAAEGIRRCDPKRSALIYSGSCTNEDIYTAHKFAQDILRTSNVDSSARLTFGPLLNRAGTGAPAARLSELKTAAAVLVVGADPDFSHPVLALALRRAAMAGTAQLVSVGLHRSGLSPYAACEVLHAPGEERQVLELLHERLGGGEGGQVREDVERAVEVLEAARSRGPCLVLYGSDPMRRLDGTANLEFLEAIAKALSAEVLPLLSRANDRGAIEIAAALGCQGLTFAEIFGVEQGGQLDLLYLIGEDVWPGGDGAKCAKFVVVQDMFLPAGAADIADVVFPAASFAEVDGTYTNLEGKVQRLRRAVSPPGTSKPDWEILSKLAQCLGVEGLVGGDACQVMTELAGAVPFFEGAQYDSLEEGVFFGRPEAGNSEARAPKARKRDHPRQVAASVGAASSEAPSADFPFWLVVDFDEFAHRATPLSSQVYGLKRLEPAPALALSIADAETLGVGAGTPVRVISRRGDVIAKARPSESLQPGVLRMVGRGGEGSPVPMLGLLLDPVSKTPEGMCAVRLERL